MEIYKASQVANFFLDKGEEEDRPITMLKLIKVCYIAHGWKLALSDNPLFEENVEAWKYGPVIPSLYHEFKHFQKNPITSRATELDFENFNIIVPKLPKRDSETRGILKKVWDVYKTVSGSSLISRTHADGTPWKECYKSGEENFIIPTEKIKVYYKQLIRNLVSNVG